MRTQHISVTIKLQGYFAIPHSTEVLHSSGGQIFGIATSNGGLHGAITSAPDGTVYVPRELDATVILSKAMDYRSERTMGLDVGTPYPRKNRSRY